MKNIKEIIVLICCLSLIFPAPIVFAAPQGGKVVGGSAKIHQSGTTTTINQSSDRAIINWHSFDIGKNEAVWHSVPSAKSAGLHRVVGGGGASQIQGLLQSNGNIYLVNPAGVVIHKGARVDTNSFIATTRDIADSNFMKGKMVFDRPGCPGAQIINQGTISVKESGLAALVAPTVRNEGLIAGKLGKVALASGDSTWKLDMYGDDLITFTVNEKDVNALRATDGTPLAGAGVENSGSIKAEGGMVVLTAAQLDGIVGSVVNSGEVSAASAEVKGGKITFRGKGSHLDVRNTGIVDASSAKADGGVVRMVADGTVASSGTVAATGGQKGGKAVLTGRDVALTGHARIDVSGATGGGTTLVGGNALGKGPERNAQTTKVESGSVIYADAKFKGDGGQVVVWSDEKTTFDGTITARGGKENGNGGMVETSGKSLKVGNTARVDTSVKKGVHGQWLLDPVDFVIAASGGDMTGATVSANLELGDVAIRSKDGQGGNDGNIEIKDPIEWFSNFNLTLNASNAVNVNADITLHGDYSSLYVVTSPEQHLHREIRNYNLLNGKVSFLGKNNKYFINNNEYKIIHSIIELQNWDVNHLFYALANDIDASATKMWNNGAGFIPLEDVNGVLNGGNHVIKGLYINSPEKYSVGLIGWNSSLFAVNNLGLLDVDITGHSNVGGLIGTASGVDVRIGKVGVTGQVSGVGNVGGVIGYYSTPSGEIHESYSHANVKGNSNVGGFAGYLNRGVWGSYSSGNVSGQNNVGGFVGYIDGGGFVYCYSRGNILGKPQIAGGFVGYSKNSRFQDCYSTGTIIPPVAVHWGHPFLGDGEHSSAHNCYVDYETSHANGDPFAGRWPGEGVYGVSTADMKNGNAFRGYPWIVDGINYPNLDIIYTFASNGSGDNPPSPDLTPNPDPTPTPSPNPIPTPDHDLIADIDNMDISQIIRYSKDQQKLIDGVKTLPNSLYDKPNLPEDIPGGQKELNNFRKIGQNTINSIKKKIGEDLYEKFNLKNNSEKIALAKVKKQIKITHTMIGKSNIPVPEEVYEAFAQSIIDSIGSSKIDKFSTNQNKLLSQIASTIQRGFKNHDNQLEIGGIIYQVKGSTTTFGGVGFALCTINWVGKNGKHFSANLVWASTPEEGMKALSEYCIALNELHREAWNEAASYVLTGTPNAKKYFDIGDKVIKSIYDKEYAKDFGKEIGESFAKQFTGGFIKNKFETFIEKNIPNGSNIIGAAKALKKIESKYEDIVGLISESKDYSKQKGDFLKACKLLMSHYNYAANEVVELERALGL